MVLRIALLLFCVTFSICGFSQQWTKAQLDAANTAKDISTLSQVEKDAIRYINLCRLYPANFAKIEVEAYEMDPAYGKSYLKSFHAYKKTLLTDLENRKACAALSFENTLFLDAKCYANEISKSQRNGHERIDCKKSNYAECLSFGQGTGKEIALQWLIDAGIKDLGHRNICLEPSYQKIGLSTTSHFQYRFCAVAELM